MSYLIIFAIVWWKLDFLWAVASVAAVYTCQPWHPNAYRRATEKRSG